MTDTKPRGPYPKAKPKQRTLAQRMAFCAPISEKSPPRRIPPRDRMGVK